MAFKVNRIGIFITAAYLLGLFFLVLDDGIAIAGSILLGAALISDRLIQNLPNRRVFALMWVGYVAGALLLFFDFDYPHYAFRGPVLLASCLLCDVAGRRLEQGDLAEHDLSTRVNRLESAQSDED